ncbi:hypothetical protein BO221_28700 [Archangium sp. Cb G35]|uniref:Vgb family protein n=1 Tax=Archangium sp. Cb G35 TaxID=1920190 RepID=UPI0009362DE1|nr:NHL repeat-containing protein [Archangium sp. Cb G35]OJT20881.1 hypothetical protein BO221_28700 [Archangium sp. Cb G35]
MNGQRLWSAVLAVCFIAGCGVSDGMEQEEPTGLSEVEEARDEGEFQDDEELEAQWKQPFQLIYEEYFGKGAGPEWSIPRTSKSPNGQRRFLGPFNQEEVVLQLDELSAHDEVKVTLELFVLGTWDGNSTCCGPDRWVAQVDGGPVLLDATFSNDDAPFDPGFSQSYPGPYPGSSNPGLTGAAEKGTLGYPDESGYGGVGDSIYRLTFTVPHSASSLKLRFTDPPRGDANELWGLDCVRIKVRKKEVKQGDLLVTRNTDSSVLRYDGRTGAFAGVFIPPGSGGLANPQGMTYGPDGNLYIASFESRNVLRYDGRTGAFLGVFVTPGSGGLGAPNDLIFGPDGHLYVSDGFFGTNSVLRYDGRTGAFLGVFASGGGLSVPQHLAFGPDGNLFVESVLGNDVLRYDGRTGAPLPAPGESEAVFIRDIDPVPLAFGPDGKLYVGTTADDVRRYNGRTGALIDVFVPPGSGGLNSANDLVFGPDGNLYLPSFLGDSVFRFNGRTGAFMDLFVPPGGGGLARPISLTFMPSDKAR